MEDPVTFTEFLRVLLAVFVVAVVGGFGWSLGASVFDDYDTGMRNAARAFWRWWYSRGERQ